MTTNNDNGTDLPGIENLKNTILDKSKDMARKLPILGHVTWLATQSKMHRHLFIQDIESRFLPPIVLAQSKLYVQSKTGGLPMAFASWAFLNKEAETRYMAGQRLAPSDWKSGENLWLIDVLAPFGGADAIYKELYHEIFKEKEIHFLMPTSDSGFRKTTINEIMKAQKAKEADKPDEVSTH